jgi:hypothetical protein
VFDVAHTTATDTITVNSVADATVDGPIYNLGRIIEWTTFNATDGTAHHTSDLAQEFALKPETVYLIGLYNAGAAPYDVAIWALWSEDE